jgi:hypothetical protein
MTYKPQQRAVPATILTRGGWLRGTLHVAEKSRLADALNRQGEFQRVTDVTMPGRFERLDFLAVHRDAMYLVVPELAVDDEPPRNPNDQPEWQRVAFLLEGGVAEGSVATLKDVRVSDFFANRSDFVSIHDVVLRFTPEGAVAVERRAPRAVINSGCVIGIADLGHVSG